jgi:hypothetical protein
MTQEDKELLLKDLCARLPYGVKVLNMAERINEVCELDSIKISRKHKDKIFVSLTLPNDSVMTGIEMVKPYLRPMSSMTEEERKEYWYITSVSNHCDAIDWLNKKMFAYRTINGFDMFELGLALKAPEGMYD